MADYLTRNARNDIDKVRAIFRWIASVDVSALQHRTAQLPDSGTPLDYLLKINWKMGNHANFTAQLARYLNNVILSVRINSITRHLKLGMLFVVTDGLHWWSPNQVIAPNNKVRMQCGLACSALSGIYYNTPSWQRSKLSISYHYNMSPLTL